MSLELAAWEFLMWGKLVGNLKVAVKPPDNYGRNFHLYKVLLFLG